MLFFFVQLCSLSNTLLIASPEQDRLMAFKIHWKSTVHQGMVCLVHSLLCKLIVVAYVAFQRTLIKIASAATSKQRGHRDSSRCNQT